MLKLEEEEHKYEDKSIKKGKNFNLDDYITMMLIGSGNFSEIYMVEHKTTKILYSMKTFQKMRVEQLHKEIDVLMEKHVMEKIKPHKNIIGYFGSAKDDFQMYILYEYINGGDLWKRVVIYGMPCEKRAKYYFIQILNAIKHMHSFNIPHRDIKPENILVTKNEKLIKIIDFGSACDLDGTEFEKKFEEIRKKEKNRKPSYKHFVGTPNFMAPECVHNQFSDKRSDYWSLGCVLYNILTGFPPFLGASEYLIFQKSIEAKFIFPKGILSEDAEDLIKKCIVIDPDKRLNIDQMLNHPYLKNEYEDKNFMENLPQMNLDEEEFFNVRKSLLKKYEKFKQHSNDLDSIKKNEDMEEDLRRNDITPEPTENDKIMKELTSRKDIIKKEYDEALENCIKDLHSYRKEDNDENRKFNCKLDFLETQIKHDIFNIIYRGYEGNPINLKDDSSDDEKKK
jgi:3-phosphoinositide dependent protein kinase-1